MAVAAARTQRQGGTAEPVASVEAVEAVAAAAHPLEATVARAAMVVYMSLHGEQRHIRKGNARL